MTPHLLDLLLTGGITTGLLLTGGIPSGLLLTGGVAIELLCCAGLLLFRSPFDRLHLLGPASLAGPALIAAAVLIDGAAASACIKTLLVVILLVISGPVITHATARAIWLCPAPPAGHPGETRRRHGDNPGDQPHPGGDRRHRRGPHA